MITVKDFNRGWILAVYGLGRPVSEIADELGKSTSYVYDQMRQRPENYDDVKRLREEQYNLTLRRVRGLADQFTLSYLETLQGRLNNPDLSDEQKDTLFEQIDQVAKIARQYSDRISALEERAMEASAGAGANRLPFKVIITRLPEGKTPEEIVEEGDDIDD
jgi:hypothetical protein